MNFHECLKLFYPDTKLIIYDENNQILEQGHAKDMHQNYQTREVKFVSGRADTNGVNYSAVEQPSI